MQNYRQKKEGPRERNGSVIDKISQLPINSKVWVRREYKGWTGPLTLLPVDGKDYVVKSA